MMIHSVTPQRTQTHLPGSFLVLLLGLVVLVGCGRRDDLGPVANIEMSERIRAAFTTGGAGAETGVAVATGTGWGTLKGKFVYDGEPPEMQPYGVNKDMEACTIGGKAPLQETLLVDPASKGIASVAVFVRSVSRVHESAQTSAGEAVFDQKECKFLSHVFPLRIGQTIAIKNSDPVGHNTNIEGKNSFNQTIPADASINFKPQKEEAVPVGVRCSIHPWMSAWFLPRANGYVAVTAADGSFEIPNLPAGEELEFQVWHESAAPGKLLVLTTPEAKKLKWSKKGRFKVKLGEDEVKELNLTVPPAAFGG